MGFSFLRTMFVLTIFKDKQQPVYPSGNKDGRLFGISFGRLIRLFIFLTTGSSSSTPFSTPRQPLPPPLSLPPFSGTQPTYRSPQTSRRQVGSSIILSKLSRVLVWGRGLHLNTTSFLQACLHFMYHFYSVSLLEGTDYTLCFIVE